MRWRLFAFFALLAVALWATPALAHEDDPGPPRPDLSAKVAELHARNADLVTASSTLTPPSGYRTLTAAYMRRRDLVDEVARNDPATALRLSMEPAFRAKLPTLLRGLVEERVYLVGS